MLFNSINFLIFFPIVTLLYFIIPHRVRYIWLLIASYYFYMAWNPVYALLMLTSTFITYLSGILIDRANNLGGGNAEKLKKLWVILSLVLNLSILFFFKYFYFAVDNINILLSALHIQLIQPKFDIILPVGISFYTFQALSYTIDVYRKEVYAERNFLKYALFVSFFPQLVAGPIERSKNLLVQVSQKHTFSFERMRDGLLLMLFGYFLKMVIADRAAILVNHVFENYEAYAGIEIAIAVVMFAVQVYGDFAGYSAIAMGAAWVMGFKLMQNFNHPYFATSIQDYWGRWHISLSTWLRDYVYLPIIFSGKKLSNLRNYFAIMVTFFISGLWHGANWTYVVWGLYHGFCIVMAEITNPYKKKLYKKLNVNTKCFSFRLSAMIVTFILVNIGYLIFRAPDFHTAYEMWKQMFSIWNPWIFFDNSLYDMGLDRKDFWVLCFSIIILWVVSFMQEKGIKIRESLAQQNLVFRWLIYLLTIFGILTFGIYGPEYNAGQFIYFRF